MKVELAEHAGFCFGVKRALKLVEDNLDTLKKPVKMYGALVHNEEVVKELRRKGVELIASINQVTEGTLIITAHGVSPEIKAKIDGKDVEVLDTTCPRVAHIHHIVDRMKREYRLNLIYGDRRHQEVKGICGAAGKNSKIFSSIAGLKKLDINPHEKYGLVSQTTQNQEKFRKVKNMLKERVKDIKIYDTICNSTSWRQQEAKKMAKTKDVMIVIGSRSSANTLRLHQISVKVNPETYLIQTYKDIKKKWFHGQNKVGVTAGASTPDWVIREVMEVLEKMEERK